MQAWTVRIAGAGLFCAGVRISGTKVEGYLDGKLYLEHTLAQPVSGRIGLWSKADSHMYFSDYTVMTAN